MYEELGRNGGGGGRGGGGGGRGGGGGGRGGGGRGGGGGGWGGGGHHHHGGGFVGVPWSWGGYWGGYPYPASELVVLTDTDEERERDRRAMAYIMSLPKKQRAAAYQRIFGRAAPEGALGAFDLDTLKSYALPVGLGIAAYMLFIRKRRGRGR